MKTILALAVRILFIIIWTVIITLMLIQTLKNPEYTTLNKVGTVGLTIAAEVLIAIDTLIPAISNRQEKKDNHKDKK